MRRHPFHGLSQVAETTDAARIPHFAGTPPGLDVFADAVNRVGRAVTQHFGAHNRFCFAEAVADHPVSGRLLLPYGYSEIACTEDLSSVAEVDNRTVTARTESIGALGEPTKSRFGQQRLDRQLGNGSAFRLTRRACFAIRRDGGEATTVRSTFHSTSINPGAQSRVKAFRLPRYGRAVRADVSTPDHDLPPRARQRDPHGGDAAKYGDVEVELPRERGKDTRLALLKRDRLESAAWGGRGGGVTSVAVLWDGEWGLTLVRQPDGERLPAKHHAVRQYANPAREGPLSTRRRPSETSAHHDRRRLLGTLVPISR